VSDVDIRYARAEFEHEICLYLTHSRADGPAVAAVDGFAAADDALAGIKPTLYVPNPIIGCLVPSFRTRVVPSSPPFILIAHILLGVLGDATESENVCASEAWKSKSETTSNVHILRPNWSNL
jgi:hypothetical protein